MVALPPPNPLFRHRDDVWVKESWVRFSGLTLQTRMVILRLGDGLLLYSPSPASPGEEFLEEIRELGEVRWMVAPNEIHNVGLASFQQAYPSAHTTGCVGHPRRAPDVHFDALLDAASTQDQVPWTASGEVEFHVIGGNRFLHEIAFFHHGSRTLVLTDAIELVDASHVGGRLPGRAMLWMLDKMGLVPGVPCMSPEHNLYCFDPDALEASRRVLSAWDFESIIMAHGRIVEGDEARRALESAFERTISTARRRGGVTRAFWGLAARVQ